MTDTLLDGGGDAGGSSRAVRALGAGLVALFLLFFLLALPLIMVGGVVGGVEKACSEATIGSVAPHFPRGSGSWTATSYGPPWSDGNGSGVTATGVDLRPARPAYLIAVDPSVIALRSYVHVWPNPFGKRDIAFYAGDTGGKIDERHIDIYDWRGRTVQNGWGVRSVDVTPAAAPGSGNLLAQVPPAQLQLPPDAAAACSALDADAGPLRLSPGDRARVLLDGSATAPRRAPLRVKQFIAAANLIYKKPYHYGGGHGPSLDTIQPWYDCSSSTSFALHRAGMLGPSALVSGDLASWGAPGPGRWLTVYANGGHVFVIVAGISWNTAHYGQTYPPGSGPRWSYDITGQLANDTFTARHWPGM